MSFDEVAAQDTAAFNQSRERYEHKRAIELLRELVAGTSYGGQRKCHSAICSPDECGRCGKFVRAEQFLESIGVSAK